MLVFVVNFEHIQCINKLFDICMQVCAATAQINTTIKHFFYHVSHEPLLKIYHQDQLTRTPMYYPHRTWRRSGVFIVTFEHISRLVVLFLLVTLSR